MSGEYSEQLEGDRERFARQMWRLARLGRGLWTALFEREMDSALWHVGNWLEANLKREGIIQVTVDRDAQSFMFPWNLLFDGELPEREGDMPSLHGFWGYRYAIEQRLPTPLTGPASSIWSDEPVRLDDGFEIGFVLWPFKQAPQQRKLIEDLTSRGHGQIATGGPIVSQADAFALLSDCRSHILYFFTHGYTRQRDADIGGLDFLKMYGDLPEDSPLRAHWRTLYEQTRQPTFDVSRSRIQPRYGNVYLDDLYTLEREEINLHNNPVVILNMCESAQATPSLSESFVHFFINRGARCVIGTECTMMATFAHHFSEELLQSLLGGDTIGDAFLKSRRKFLQLNNPLGLAYTLFGSATARFEPPPFEV
jgi:hypothetical protein